jgi:hypothetical protein
MKEQLARIEAYGKAHWKELLALVLAAIPAAFLLFHKGAQQAAANAMTYIPAAFGGGDPGATPAVDPGAAVAAAAAAPAQAVAAVTQAVTGTPPPPPSTTLGTSVNGSNPIVSPPIPKTAVVATARVPPPGLVPIRRQGGISPAASDIAPVASAPPPAPAPAIKKVMPQVRQVVTR